VNTVSAVVLSIRELFTHTRSRDWDNQERAHLARVLESLERAGFDAELEIGLSDEGDPWAVFCLADTNDVIVHIARIDNLYIFDSSILNVILQGKSFDSIVEKFIQMRSIVLPKAQKTQSTQISLHPSAMLSAIVLTAFLVADEIRETLALSGESDIRVADKNLTEVNTTFLHQLAELFLGKVNSDKACDTQTSQCTHIGLLAVAFIFVTDYLSDGVVELASDLKQKVLALADLQSDSDFSDDNSVDFLSVAENPILTDGQQETFYQNAEVSEGQTTPVNTASIDPLHPVDQSLEAYNHSVVFEPSALDTVQTPAFRAQDVSDLFDEFSDDFIQIQRDTPQQETELTSEQSQVANASPLRSTPEFNKTILQDLTPFLNAKHAEVKEIDPATFFEVVIEQKSLQDTLISAFMETADNIRMFSFNGDLFVYDRDVLADMQTDAPVMDMLVRETTVDDINIIFIGVADEVNAAFASVHI
jgi:hypothetical protein